MAWWENHRESTKNIQFEKVNIHKANKENNKKEKKAMVIFNKFFPEIGPQEGSHCGVTHNRVGCPKVCPVQFRKCLDLLLLLW